MPKLMCIMNSEEEDLIEAEIQRELALLTPTQTGIAQNEDYELEDNLDEVEMVDTDYAELDDNDATMPDSVQRYLNMVNKRSDELQKDLEECDNLLQDSQQENNTEFFYHSAQIKELAFILGEDPEELRDRVLTEVEDEERKESEHVTDHVTNPETDPRGELGANTDSLPAPNQRVHTPGKDSVNVEQKAWQDLLELDGKLKQQQLDLEQEAHDEILQQASRDELKSKSRSEKLQQHAQELKQMRHYRKIVEAKVELEMEVETKKTEEVLNKHQADIEKFAKDTEEERLEFERHLAVDKELKEKQRLHAATLIQAAVRSYRVRKKYSCRLNRLRDERHQRQVQDRQMEIVAFRRAEEQRKKRERDERKRKEEDERRRKEEIQRQEDEERLRKERLEKERLERERKETETAEKQNKEEEIQRREEQLKQEQELDERTRDILSKIKNEVGSPSRMADEKRTENETHDQEIQNEQEVFLTDTRESLTSERRYPDDETVTDQPTKNLAETSTLFNSSDATMPVRPDTGAVIDSPTTSSEDSSPAPVLDSASAGLTEDKTAVTQSQSAIQSIGPETTDTNPCNKQVVLDSCVQGDSTQVSNDKMEEVRLQDGSTTATLAADIEARRFQWMQNCVSQRSVASDVKSIETRRMLRRVHAANKLPALTSSQLLAASESGTQLSQVTVVAVENSTPCSLSSLTSCTNLTCLHLQQCGIKLLEGLDHCSNITYIDLQHNQVEGIHCRDRTGLKQVMLQNNKLTSSCGLEGCSQLRYLQLSRNSITRTGGLQSLVNLTHLDLSHNQLVSISGIGQLGHLTDLNLSHNHLSSVNDLQTCCLLQRLNIESNSLVEMPPVQNHVLLNDLRLNDNSISSIVSLSEAWLPMLQYVFVAQNSLLDLPDMKNCLMLRRLDASHNCIGDVDVIVNGLKDCNHLEEVCLDENPVTHDDHYRCTVLDALPWLRILDNKSVYKPIPVSTRTPFERMCLSQIHAQEELSTAYEHHTSSRTDNSPNDILQANRAREEYLEGILEQAVRHRRMHEIGDMTEIQRVLPSSELLSLQGNDKQITDSSDDHSKITLCYSPTHVSVTSQSDVLTRDQSCPLNRRIESLPSSKQAENDTNESCPSQQGNSYAATVIQARWRGYVVRRDLNVHTTQYLAALRIQTLWRGYRVRKMVAVARRAARYDSEDEETMLYEDIDPTSWGMAEAEVDSDWLPSETPCLPRSYPCLPSTKKLESSHQPALHPDEPEPPRQAWYASPSPSNVYTIGDAEPQLIRKPPIPPGHWSPASDTPRTTRSHRQDQITEEWGFKDASTAELMMKRARKLSKGSSTHKKKTLDPLQRYQQMKKVHGSARLVPSPKRGVQRQEFFQAREREIQNATAAQKQEKDHQDARTFEWVHGHAGVHSDTMSDCGRHSSSEPNLPAISPNALQGRVQLMASPLLELQSVDGTSSMGSIPNRSRSQSVSAQSHEELRLPAIKTNSAPSGRRHEGLTVDSTGRSRGRFGKR